MDKRRDNLPHTELSDLRRQMSYYEALKKRAIENCNKKIADYEARQDRIANQIAVMENEAAPVTVVDTTITVHRATDPMATAQSIRHQLTKQLD